MSYAKELMAEQDEISHRRYKCPNCEEYNLHIESNVFAQCEQGCFIEDEDEIKELIETEKYKGYFSDEDLEGLY